MIAYCRDTWGGNIPVIIFSVTFYGNNNIADVYGFMVDKVHEIEEKWDNVDFLDFWNDVQMNDITEEQFQM